MVARMGEGTSSHGSTTSKKLSEGMDPMLKAALIVFIPLILLVLGRVLHLY